jgi:hypothetical protein
VRSQLWGVLGDEQRDAHADGTATSHGETEAAVVVHSSSSDAEPGGVAADRPLPRGEEDRLIRPVSRDGLREQEDSDEGDQGHDQQTGPRADQARPVGGVERAVARSKATPTGRPAAVIGSADRSDCGRTLVATSAGSGA